MESCAELLPLLESDLTHSQENLHPRLGWESWEKGRGRKAASQPLATTHSPRACASPSLPSPPNHLQMSRHRAIKNLDLDGEDSEPASLTRQQLTSLCSR